MFFCIFGLCLYVIDELIKYFLCLNIIVGNMVFSSDLFGINLILNICYFYYLGIFIILS